MSINLGAVLFYTTLSYWISHHGTLLLYPHTCLFYISLSYNNSIFYYNLYIAYINYRFASKMYEMSTGKESQTEKQLANNPSGVKY